MPTNIINQDILPQNPYLKLLQDIQGIEKYNDDGNGDDPAQENEINERGHR